MSKQELTKLERYILIDSIKYRSNKTNYKGFENLIKDLKKSKYKYINDFCYMDLIYFRFLLNEYIKIIPSSKTFKIFSIKNFYIKIKLRILEQEKQLRNE